MEKIKTKSFELAINIEGNKDSRKVALLLPGRFDTKDYWNFKSHLQFLADNGFLSVCLDPPGTWDSPGSVNLFTTTNYIKAVNELIEYFGNKPTLLVGHSRGGQVAMLVAVTNHKVIGFVSINGSFGPAVPPGKEMIKDGVVTEYRDLPPGSTKSTQQKEFKYSLEYFSDSKKYDVVSKLKNCLKPKLIIYSTRDEFADPEDVLEIYNSLPEPKMKYQLDSKHDYRYQEESVEQVNQAIGHFLEKYLGGV